MHCHAPAKVNPAALLASAQGENKSPSYGSDPVFAQGLVITPGKAHPARLANASSWQEDKHRRCRCLMMGTTTVGPQRRQLLQSQVTQRAAAEPFQHPRQDSSPGLTALIISSSTCPQSCRAQTLPGAEGPPGEAWSLPEVGLKSEV